MDRSRRGGAKSAGVAAAERDVPASSRLTLRAADPRARKNRRRRAPVWSRVPGPRAIADACGRAVRRSVPGIVVTCALAVVGTGLWLGHRFVTTSDRFAITEIRIEGTSRLDPAGVRAALPIAIGDNVFAADLDDLAARLRARPWIATAEVRRILPHTLVVELAEHVPAAVVTLGEAYLVDATGHPFKRVERDEASGLPLVTGLDRAAYLADPDATARAIVDALDVLAAWRAGERPAIDRIHVTGRGVALGVRDHGLTIELGPARTKRELIARMTTFDAAWGALEAEERVRAREIHLGNRLDHVSIAFKE